MLSSGYQLEVIINDDLNFLASSKSGEFWSFFFHAKLDNVTPEFNLFFSCDELI